MLCFMKYEMPCRSAKVKCNGRNLAMPCTLMFKKWTRMELSLIFCNQTIVPATRPMLLFPCFCQFFGEYEGSPIDLHSCMHRLNQTRFGLSREPTRAEESPGTLRRAVHKTIRLGECKH